MATQEDAPHDADDAAPQRGDAGGAQLGDHGGTRDRTLDPIRHGIDQVADKVKGLLRSDR